MSKELLLEGRYYRMFPPSAFKGFAERRLRLPVDSTAMLVVDVYGPDEPSNRGYSGMVSDHSKSMASRILRDNIKPALDAARAIKLPVVYCANSAPRIALRRSAYWEQKWDTQGVDKDDLYSEDNIDPMEYHCGNSNVLKYTDISRPKPGDYFVRKHVHSGFFDSRLDTLLRNLGIRNLICVGFALDMCLGTTMIDALWRNYRVLLLRDCTYAVEIPGIDEPGHWTGRWITYVECAIGYTSTAPAFIQACRKFTEPAATLQKRAKDLVGSSARGGGQNQKPR